MNTILVWVLVTVGGHKNNDVVYSPPMIDKATCEHLQKSTAELVNHPYEVKSRCVQIRMVVTK